MLLLAALASFGIAGAIATSSQEPEARPNVVLVFTDDQDLMFDSCTRAMPFTSSFVGAGGAAFSNFFAHTPVCCPSRGEMLTGRYLHNMKPSDPDERSCMRLRVDDAFHNSTWVRALQVSSVSV